jgi:hypothetical protein
MGRGRRVRARLRRGRRGRWQFTRRCRPKAGRWHGTKSASPRSAPRSATSASSRHGAGVGLDARAARDSPPLREGVGGGGRSHRLRRSHPTLPEGRAKHLNLFGYTGVGTLALSECGPVTHVDASKKSVAQARENAVLSRMAETADPLAGRRLPRKFAAREVRAGKALRRDHPRPAQVRPRARRRGLAARGRPAAADRRLPPAARCGKAASCSSPSTPCA